MKLRWHKFRARLLGYYRVLRGYPWEAGVVEDGEFRFRKTFVIRLLYRIGKGDYWKERAEQLSCGCTGYQDYIIWHLADCPEHGIDALLPED